MSPNPQPQQDRQPQDRPSLGLSVRNLRHRYFVMRHAESRPNVTGVIVCRPPAGLDPVNGLTELGRQQAHDHAVAWAASRTAGPVPLIISSDFSRTVETAEILRSVVSAGPIGLDVRLRERDFGPYDGGPATAYDEIWAIDGTGGTATGVEPVSAVRARVLALITELESTHTSADIVLVSHGDTSQITQATFAGLPAKDHRSLPHLGNAEIRALNPAG